MTPNLTDLPDSDLILRTSRGDNLAFGILYERYLDRIYNHVFYRVSNRTEAEDITETVFFNAWQFLSNREKKSAVRNFPAWLYRIAHNEVVKHHRSHLPTVNLDDAKNLSGTDLSPEANLQALQVSENLANAIGKLEPKLQQVLVCRFIDQLSHGEIAKIMDLKPGHVRVLQHRALKQMQLGLSEKD